MTGAMTCIVPLAGPDFVHPRHGIRPLMEVDGMPLLERTLTTRAWWRDGHLRPERMVFILRDLPEAAAVRDLIARRFAGARVATLSDLTAGALLSALAGTALVPAPDAPLCVDLVDILYDCPEPVPPLFSDPKVGGVLPWFPSDAPRYSYLEIVDGKVVRTAEKRVISSHASAGTYFFRDLPTFLEAAAWSLRRREEVSRQGVFYLCPSYNALIERADVVLPVEVRDVRSYS